MSSPLFRRLRAAIARVFGFRERARWDARLDEETRFHLEMAERRFIRDGMTADDARRAARLAFGGRDRWHEAARDQVRSRPLEEVALDVRYALRMLRRSPAFTVAAVTTLALSVGATASIFSVVNAVLLRALPYPAPERIVVLCEHNVANGMPCNTLNAGNFLAWRDVATSFAEMGAFVDQRVSIAGGGEDPVSVQARLANASVFSILGARPTVGRLFSEADDRDGGPNVMVLSHAFWQSHFGGDRSVVGRKVLLQAYEYTIIGVLSPDFGLYRPIEAWIPMRFTAGNRTAGGRSYRGIARLKPGVTVEAANREMTLLAARRALAVPQWNTNWTALTMPLRENLVGNSSRALWLLLGAVGFLLLIACANVANLLLARAVAREREVAVRISLGASPGRIARQLVTESVALSVVSTLIGFLVAIRATPALVALVPPGLAVQRLDQVSVDWRVLLFTAGVAVTTGVIFGLAPAWHALRADLRSTLTEGSRGAGSSRAHGRARNALVVAEMSIALVLLAGAGLMTRSLAALRQVRLGFEPTQVLTGNVVLPRRRYPSDTAILAFYKAAEARIAALPGVTAVGAISYLPLTGQRASNGFNVEGRPAAQPGMEPIGDMRAVTPGYFEAMGIAIKEGRALTDADRADAPKVAVVGETLARTMWPGESAIGHYLLYEWNENERVRIVGVAADVRDDGPSKDAFLEIYRPLTQFSYAGMSIVVRGTGDPSTYATPLRDAIRSVDGTLPVANVHTMSSLVRQSVGETRLSTMLFGLFGGLGLVLAAIGLYGVMSYSVQQRRHEIGVRVALGAGPAEVMHLVLRGGATLAGIGIAIGAAGAFVLTRLMTKLLFNVSPTDLLTFATIAGILAAVALGAAYIPGRRAARVDPVTVLRGD